MQLSNLKQLYAKEMTDEDVSGQQLPHLLVLFWAVDYKKIRSGSLITNHKVMSKSLPPINEAHFGKCLTAKPLFSPQSRSEVPGN